MNPIAALGLLVSVAAPPGPVSVKAAFRPARAAPGGRVSLELRLSIAEGYHIYALDQDPEGGIPTSLQVEAAPGLALEGAPRGPAPKIEKEPTLGTELREYEGRIALEQPMRVAEGAGPGEVTVSGTVRLQPCTATSCLLPEEEPFRATLIVTAAKPEPVSLSAAFRPARAAPGGRVTLELRLSIAEGYHIYALDQDPEGGIPTSLQVEAAPGLALDGAPTGPAPKIEKEPTLGTELREYAGEIALEQPMRVAEDAEPGEVTVTGTVRYQACTASSCLFPVDDPFRATLRIEAAAGTAPGRVGRALAEGFWAVLAIAVGAALLSLVTPCVFPMIPITVSFFAQQAKQRSGRVVSLAGAYALGIIATYAILGVVLVLAFGAAGLDDLARSPWLNLFLALLCFACALSLLGLYEFRIPAPIVNRLQAKGSGAGLAGTALLGVSFTLVAFSCTGPIIGPLFSALAAGAHRTTAFAGILAYAVTFALPFFLLALFPKLVSALPRSGGWLEAGKVTLGFVLLAVALFFASNVNLLWEGEWIPRSLFLAAWCALSALAGLYLVGILRIGKAEGEGGVGPGRLIFGAAFVALAIFLGTGIGGRRLPGRIGAFLDALPPPDPWPWEEIAASGPAASGLAPESPAPAASGRLSWLGDYEGARARARSEQKPLLVYFSGHICVKCRAMERGLFPDPGVRHLMERFVRVKLMADAGGEAGARARALQSRLVGATSVPALVVVLPDGGRRGPLLGTPRDAAALTRFLRDALRPAAGAG